MLKGKNIVLAVTGSIAAYKMANVASALVKQHANVTVMMTQNATNFINPITFETLTGNKCLVDTFDRNFQYSVEHVSLANSADVCLIAPATANVIAKMAYGLADDMLTTTVLACRCKKIVSPAMNTNMFENQITQDNINKLAEYGFEIIEPDSGRLACGDVGAGKLPSEEVLLSYIYKEVMYEKDLAGKNVLITAGPTRESIDPVRFISNHSTGKMGYAFAKVCSYRGANVTLITGPTSIPKPDFVNIIEVESADEMFEAVDKVYKSNDIIVMSAAVADYTPVTTADEKIKKSSEDFNLSLRKTRDILDYVGHNRTANQKVIGFAMETQNLIENASKKLEKKNADMIVANSLKTKGAGFGTDTNIVTLISKDKTEELSIMSKEETANTVIDRILEM